MCAAQVVGNRQHVTSKICHCVSAGVLNIALGALAQVFHLGNETQHLILEFSIVSFERCNRICSQALGINGFLFGFRACLSLAAFQKIIGSTLQRITIPRIVDIALLKIGVFGFVFFISHNASSVLNSVWAGYRVSRH